MFLGSPLWQSGLKLKLMLGIKWLDLLWDFSHFVSVASFCLFYVTIMSYGFIDICINATLIKINEGKNSYTCCETSHFVLATLMTLNVEKNRLRLAGGHSIYFTVKILFITATIKTIKVGIIFIKVSV